MANTSDIKVQVTQQGVGPQLLHAAPALRPFTLKLVWGDATSQVTVSRHYPTYPNLTDLTLGDLEELVYCLLQKIHEARRC